MSLALDGSVAGTTTAASLAVSLTTSNGNDIVVVIVTCNGGPVVSVTAAGLTFARAGRNGSFATNIEMWWARAPVALSSKSITVTQTSSAFISISAFGVSGNPVALDPNALLPSVIGDGSGTGTGSLCAITTTQNQEFMIGAYRFAATANPTAGAGWTQISGANFMLTEYKVVSTKQNATSVGIVTGFTNENGGIAHSLTTGLSQASYVYGGA